MGKFRKAKKAVCVILLAGSVVITALSGITLTGQQGGIRNVYASCEGQPPGPDYDCPIQPTPTPTPSNQG